MKALDIRRRSAVPPTALFLGCFSFLPALAVAATSTAAQQVVTFSGTVTDGGTGEPVAGAVVTVGEPGRQVLTDAAGRFTVVDAPVGSQRLRVQRFGYRDVDVTVAVAPGMPAAAVRLEPAPIQLDEVTVSGDARADMPGVVRDARSGLPIPFADLTLTEGAVRDVGRTVTSGERGEFTLRDARVGAYLLRAERIGYHSAYVPVSHATPVLPLEILLEPDSALMRGLAVVLGELDLRRDAHGRATRALPERVLRAAAPTSMREFIESYTSLRIVMCGSPPKPSCLLLRGRTTRPVVHIDGFLVFETPPPTRTPGFTPPDELYGLDVLDSYSPRELYSFEYFECPHKGERAPLIVPSGLAPPGYIEIHAYTHEHMRRMASSPRVPLAPCG